MPARTRKLLERLRTGDIILREYLRPPAVLRPAAFRERLPAMIFPGQQPVRQGEIREEGDALPHALRKHALFGVAVQETVVILDADEARRAGPDCRRGFAELFG